MDITFESLNSLVSFSFVSKFADCIGIEHKSRLSRSETQSLGSLEERLGVSVPLLVFVIRDDQLDLRINDVTVNENEFLENLLRPRPGDKG